LAKNWPAQKLKDVITGVLSQRLKQVSSADMQSWSQRPPHNVPYRDIF